MLQQLWVYARLPNGDYDPTIPNNNTIFTVTGFVDANTLTVSEMPVSGLASGITASYVPLAGNAFLIESTGGLIDGVGLIYPRGFQFLLKGNAFLVTRSWSRNPTPDAGGGVRFNGGRGMRGTLLDLETSDDCFQFSPKPGETVERSFYSDCIGRTNQGALIAFFNGNGRTYDPDGDSGSFLRDCLARNIRGVTGGSVIHGGVGIKMYCANSSNATTNCWVEDVFLRQSDATPPDGVRGGLLVITGRQGGGILNCGARNLVIENRSGPLVAIAPADGLPAAYAFSKAVDLTIEQARAAGAGSWPGVPLIAAPYADRLVLRDVTGDLAGGVGANPSRALEIGTDVFGGFVFMVAAGAVNDLVIDGLATGNAALPAATGGLWKLGNVGKASVRRLSATLATSAPPFGGIELIQPSAGPGPTWCRFAELDFANTLAGKEIVSWQTRVGNRITDSIRFDDRTATIALPTGSSGTLTISPTRFAPTIVLTLASGTAAINAMSPPGPAVPSPRCTLLVPTNVTVSSGSGLGALVLTGPLTGSATASLTLQWLDAGNRWREIARTA